MDVFEAIRLRRSVRAYKADPIPKNVMEKMLQALRLAPSACNFQPWKFVVVTDSGVKAKLAEACHDQKFIAEAPVAIVGCGFPADAYKGMGGAGNSVDVDLAIALDHLTLAAVAEGLGTCWIGAFSEPRVKALLAVPEEVKVVAITPLGYPSDPGVFRADDERRKALEEIVSYDRFLPPRALA